MPYILIAEADAARAALYQSLSSDERIESVVARDGESAVATLRSRGLPALVITELSLPKLDGFQLLQTLRTMPGAATVPAIVVSAFRELRDDAVRRKAELGIGALLAKTSPVQSLQRAISNALATAVAIPASALQALPEPEPDVTPAPPAPEPASAVEARRLARIASMNLVDDLPPDEGLQKLVHETAEIFRVPVALVSLVLEDRQWFKAHVGLGPQLQQDRGTPRSWAFCRHVVEGDAPLIVPDAAVHPSFATNPLVRQGAVRGYAGVPLKTPTGEVLGTLCIIDTRPLRVSAEDLELLQLLARRVAGELELRASASRASAELARRDDELATLAAVLEHLDEGVMLLDSERRVVFANPALAAFTGFAVADIVGLSRDEWQSRVAALSAEPADAQRRLSVAPQGPYAAREELELARPEPRVLRWIAKPVLLGKSFGQLCVYADITAERNLVRQRDTLALTDFMTQLPNRRAAEEALAREIARAARTGAPLSVAIFDIDRFKRINDSLGHAAGDRALRAVADALRSAARTGDLLGRWGGEEFLAILPDVDLAGARAMAERARSLVEALRVEGLPEMTVSAGVAQLESNEAGASAVGRADAKLYEAKDSGRNRVC